jgi:hypothetical protein
MKLVKTFYLGCEDNGDIATIENNFDRINERFNAAHRPTMGILCRHFFYAQLLQQEGSLDKPYKLALICKKGRLDSKIKEHNTFTIKDTIYFFLNNMLPPEKGIIVSIYVSDTIEHTVPPYEDMRCITPMKEELLWQGDGDYITFQDAENSNPDTKQRLLNHKNKEVIQQIDNISIYPVKRITYSMGEEEIFDLLKHTKFHVSYPGGTYYSAAMINCPTIGVYLDKQFEKLDNPDPRKYSKPIHMTMHEIMFRATREGFFIYDSKSRKAVKKRQNYLRHVTNDELECYLKGYAEINWGNKYSIIGD